MGGTAGFQPAAPLPRPRLHEVKGWHSRGYLPHFDGEGITQSVNFRIVGALPGALEKAWQDELIGAEGGRRLEYVAAKLDLYLAKGEGNVWLKDPRIAETVQKALLKFDGQRYRMHAWVVMPNHVHVLFTPLENYSMSSILHSWKSFTANQANKMLERTGDFWHTDYFDRYIRNEEHYHTTVQYVESDPVRAGLCKTVHEWPFGSAAFRATRDAGWKPAIPNAGASIGAKEGAGCGLEARDPTCDDREGLDGGRGGRAGSPRSHMR